MTFWEMTPYELRLYLEGYYKRQKFEQEQQITWAYMTALWAAQWWTKKQPDPLDKILGYKDTPREMTDEEMFAIVKDLNSAMGGQVITHGGS